MNDLLLITVFVGSILQLQEVCSLPTVAIAFTDMHSLSRILQ